MYARARIIAGKSDFCDGGIAGIIAFAAADIAAVAGPPIATGGAGEPNRQASVELAGRWQSSQSSCTGPFGPARFRFMCTA